MPNAKNDAPGGPDGGRTAPRTSGLGEASASIKLVVQTMDNQVLYALRGVPTVGGRCDGKPDGTSCGFGCTCKGNVPWFDADGPAAMHIDLE